MKIVLLNPIGDVGGAERVLLDVIEALAGRFGTGAITVILLGSGPLEQRMRDLGVSVIVHRLPRPLGQLGDSQFSQRHRIWGTLRLLPSLLFSACALLRYLYGLRKLIDRAHPNVLYSNGLKTHLLSAAVKPRYCKLIWHLHDFYGARPTVARWIAIAAKRADRAVAISRAVADDAKQLAPRLDVVTILNSVDQRLFFPALQSQDANDLDRLAGLPVGGDRVLRYGLIATYANWKGHHTFLRSLAHARHQIHRPVRGYLIGGPIYSTKGSQVTESQLLQWIEELNLCGVVGLIPFQPEPASMYRMLDVVVHASTRPEPFGLTIAEAMCCGVAVVVSAAGGATELFAPEIDGLGHAPGNSAELADAMVRLGNDDSLRSRLGLAASESGKVRFSRDRFQTQIVELVCCFKP